VVCNHPRNKIVLVSDFPIWSAETFVRVTSWTRRAKLFAVYIAGPRCSSSGSFPLVNEFNFSYIFAFRIWNVICFRGKCLTLIVNLAWKTNSVPVSACTVIDFHCIHFDLTILVVQIFAAKRHVRAWISKSEAACFICACRNFRFGFEECKPQKTHTQCDCDC
jgi:hypothetical protein